MDRIIGEDHDMSIIIEMALGEIIIEMQYFRGQTFRGVIEIIIIDTITLEGVEVGPGKDNILII